MAGGEFRPHRYPAAKAAWRVAYFRAAGDARIISRPLARVSNRAGASSSAAMPSWRARGIGASGKSATGSGPQKAAPMPSTTRARIIIEAAKRKRRGRFTAAAARRRRKARRRAVSARPSRPQSCLVSISALAFCSARASKRSATLLFCERCDHYSMTRNR